MEKTRTGGPEGGPDTTVVRLPSPRTAGAISLERALAVRRSVREYGTRAIRLDEVSQLLWCVMGITDAEGHRTTPSAGATYPLEMLLLAGAVEGLAPGVYRYDLSRNDLTRVASGDRRRQLAAASGGQEWVEKAPASFLISAIYQRTAQKYSDRYALYVHMEVGNASQNLSLQAVTLGLGSVIVAAFDEEIVRKLAALGEGEVPLCLVPVGEVKIPYAL